MLTVAYRGDKTYKVLYENVSEIKSKVKKTILTASLSEGIPLQLA